MKKTFTSAMIIAIVLIMSSCFKENHSVRMKNGYSCSINHAFVGNADIGDVAPGSTSSYKSIHTGDFNISGSTSCGQSLTGSGTISGKGTHKWAITISSSGQISFIEDK